MSSNRLIGHAISLLLLVAANSVVGGDAIHGWGDNGSGHIGNGNPADVIYAPDEIPVAENVVQASTEGVIDGTSSHTLAVTGSGTVLGWGDNQGGMGHGVLGFPTTVDSVSEPTVVPGLTNVMQVATGSTFTLVLRTDGTVLAFGEDTFGQRGDGIDINSGPTPFDVGLSGITTVDAGKQHALALKSDGTVWAWGKGDYGQQGNGAGTNNDIPTQVPGLSGITAIAAGQNFSLAVHTNGSVSFWGTMSGPTQYSPVAVPNISSARIVAGGKDHSLAVLEDGTVMGWGNNWQGQLGLSAPNQTDLPLPVPGLSGVTRVSAGDRFSLAVTSGGALYACGMNNTGQVGVGEMTASFDFFQLVSSLGGVSDISAGLGFSVAIGSGSVLPPPPPVTPPPAPPPSTPPWTPPPPAFVDIVSEPTVNLETTTAGAHVVFGVAAVHNRPRPLMYTWDFGDGTVDRGPEVGPNRGHAYDSAGTYTVTVTVSNGEASDTASIEVTVLPRPLFGPHMKIDRMTVRLNFRWQGRDFFMIRGTLSEPVPDDAVPYVELGGTVHSLTDLGFSFRSRSRRGVTHFAASLRKGNLAEGLADLLPNDDVRNVPVDIPVTLGFGGQGQEFSSTVRLRYTAKKDKRGKGGR